MKIKVLDFGGAVPKRAHYNDAGADVQARTGGILYPGTTTKVPLGFGLMLPDGLVGFIFPRSSFSSRGIVCELPPIDSGYRGEVHAIVSNMGEEPYKYEAGERLGQLVVMPAVLADYVAELGDERKDGAFGSTNK